MSRQFWSVALAVAWRVLHNVFTTPSLFLPGLVFPLSRGLNVQFYVQARRAGERLLYGVTATRLVQVHTA